MLDVRVVFQFVHLKMECARFNADQHTSDKASIAIIATTNFRTAWNATLKEYRAQNVLLACIHKMMDTVLIAPETRTVMKEKNAKKDTSTVPRASTMGNGA